MTTGMRSHSDWAVMDVERDALRVPPQPSGLRAGVRGSLVPGPRVERRAGIAGVFLHLVRGRRLGGELEPDAVRIEEVDRLDEAVVGDAEHVHAVRLEP